MIYSKLNTWLNLGGIVDKAQKRFEKESGWKSNQIETTLSRFSKLGRKEQVLLGGLLLTRAFAGSKKNAKVKTQDHSE